MRLGSAAAVILAALLANDSSACGDKLVVLGGGVSFKRVMPTRHPGDILLYFKPGSQLQTAEAELGLRSALEHAGHRVRAVHDVAELEAALQSKKPDLVLMDSGQADQYAASSSAGGILFLGVRYRDSSAQEHVASASSNCVVDAEKRKGRQLLSAVSDILARRSKGQPLPCGHTT